MIESEKKIENSTIEDQVSITYYTDPLCCWSWAFEPQWRRLRYEFEGQLNWQYVMGGLIPDWNSYNDPLNSVTRPAQMGPLWFEARHISGQPINDKIWITDPPHSSYPACIAFKCAEIQSKEAGEIYLRLLREAVMLNCKNIAKREVLLEIAKNISEESETIFDFNRFEDDLQRNVGVDLFTNDLKNVRYQKIGRFPSLVLKHKAKAVIIVGYRPYTVLLEALKQVAPQIEPTHTMSNHTETAQFWTNTTEREKLELNF